jgi:hypothetical protein
MLAVLACTSGPFRSSLRLFAAGDSTPVISCACIVIVDVAFFSPLGGRCSLFGDTGSFVLSEERVGI